MKTTHLLPNHLSVTAAIELCSSHCVKRIRDVRQGPDGLLYLLTDEDNGAVLRIEPAS